MAASPSYIAYIKDLFAPFGDISARRMFGGAGVYCNGTIFALIVNDDLWLKVSNETKPRFEAAGLKAFSYQRKDGKSIAMSYYAAPEEIFDDEDALRGWTELALQAAAIK